MLFVGAMLHVVPLVGVVAIVTASGFGAPWFPASAVGKRGTLDIDGERHCFHVVRVAAVSGGAATVPNVIDGESFRDWAVGQRVSNTVGIVAMPLNSDFDIVFDVANVEDRPARFGIANGDALPE